MKNKKDQAFINQFVTISEAKKLLSYKSHDSINHLVKHGKLDFVDVAKGTGSHFRLFYVSQIMSLKTKREV